MLLKRSLINAASALILLLGDNRVNAQLSQVYPTSERDTISVFGNQLKITLSEGSFEKMSTESVLNKYDRQFNLHDVTKSNGFVLLSRDTLVFFLTSIDRPNENDNGISTWQIINSFLDKAPAYRMESGWKKLGRDYRYFVKLVTDSKPDVFFEFNFFFIQNKFAFSLLQRPIKRNSIAQEGFTFISPK